MLPQHSNDLWAPMFLVGGAQLKGGDGMRLAPSVKFTVCKCE